MSRLLLVEDDDGIRDALTLALEDLGITLTCVTNGSEALALIERTHASPTLILLDLMMPVMDGWGFAQTLRAHPRGQSVPIVIVSADGGLAEFADTINAAGWLRKPFDLEALLTLVKEQTRRR